MEEEHLGAGLLGQGVNLGQGEGAKGLGAGGGGGEVVVLTMVVDGDRVVGPRHVRLESIEPRLAQDGIKTVEGRDVEGVVVSVGGEREILTWEEEGAGLGGAIGEVDSVGGELGGGGDVVAVEEGCVDEIAVTSGVNEEVGGAVLEEASEDEEIGSSSVKVEVDGGARGWGLRGQWRRRRQHSGCWW